MAKQHEEKNFWKRTWNMNKKFNNILGKIFIFPILFFFVSMAHFCFALMHYLSKGYFLLIKLKFN